MQLLDLLVVIAGERLCRLPFLKGKWYSVCCHSSWMCAERLISPWLLLQFICYNVTHPVFVHTLTFPCCKTTDEMIDWSLRDSKIHQTWSIEDTKDPFPSRNHSRLAAWLQHQSLKTCTAGHSRRHTDLSALLWCHHVWHPERGTWSAAGRCSSWWGNRSMTPAICHLDHTTGRTIEMVLPLYNRYIIFHHGWYCIGLCSGLSYAAKAQTLHALGVVRYSLGLSQRSKQSDIFLGIALHVESDEWEDTVASPGLVLWAINLYGPMALLVTCKTM